MRRRAARALLCLCAAVACLTQPLQAGTADDDVVASIEHCRQRLGPDDDVGYARIAARCPGLPAVLERSALAPWLPRSWNEPRNDLSSGGLAELLRLQRQWQASPAANAVRAKPAQLSAVLSELQLQSTQQNSLWQRLRSWLRTLFERPENTVSESASLSQWLRARGFSDDVWSIVQGCALALLALLVVRVLWSELSLRGRQRRRRGHDAARAATDDRLPTLADVEGAPLPEQPGMLLTLIAAWLARRYLLPGAAAMTAREIAVAAPLTDSRALQQLHELVRVAEPVRYSAAVPTAGNLRRAVELGRALLVSMTAAQRT